MKSKNREPGHFVKNHNGLIHVFDPVYKVNVYACVGNKDKAFGLFKKYLRHEFDLGGERCRGKFFSLRFQDQTVGVVWSRDFLIPLIHECLHATFWVMDYRGVELDEKSEEAFTYYHSFLFDSIKSSYAK